jgi:hypothetical protein
MPTEGLQNHFNFVATAFMYRCRNVITLLKPLFAQLETGTENIRDYTSRDVHGDNYSLFQWGKGMLLLKTLL